MHSTPNATANATLQCLAAVLANDRRRINGQVLVEGEVLGLNGLCGIPLSVGRNGWHAEPLEDLAPDEIAAVMRSVQSINQFVSAIMTEAVRAAIPAEASLVA